MGLLVMCFDLCPTSPLLQQGELCGREELHDLILDQYFESLWKYNFQAGACCRWSPAILANDDDASIVSSVRSRLDKCLANNITVIAPAGFGMQITRGSTCRFLHCT